MLTNSGASVQLQELQEYSTYSKHEHYLVWIWGSHSSDYDQYHPPGIQPRSLLEVHRCFRKMHCFLLQGQKARHTRSPEAEKICSISFLIGSFFYPEDWGGTFLWYAQLHNVTFQYCYSSSSQIYLSSLQNIKINPSMQSHVCEHPPIWVTISYHDRYKMSVSEIQNSFLVR